MPFKGLQVAKKFTRRKLAQITLKAKITSLSQLLVQNSSLYKSWGTAQQPCGKRHQQAASLTAGRPGLIPHRGENKEGWFLDNESRSPTVHKLIQTREQNHRTALGKFASKKMQKGKMKNVFGY